MPDGPFNSNAERGADARAAQAMGDTGKSDTRLDRNFGASAQLGIGQPRIDGSDIHRYLDNMNNKNTVPNATADPHDPPSKVGK